MILTETIKIELNKFNSHYFRRLGYEVEGKENIDVRIQDISIHSKIKVQVKCDICQNEKNITYVKYNKNIKKYNAYSCSNKCAMFKNELTCLEKYGVKYPLQSEEIKTNLENYFLDKIGVSNPSKLESNKIKREKTMMDRYGVKTNIILPEIHKKAVEASCSLESVKKRKNTFLERLGVDNPMKSEKIYNKFKKNNLIKYGCEFPAQNLEIFIKTQKSGLKIKEYKGINYQGTYELDFLKKMESLNLLNKIEDIEPIEYLFENSTHFYFPDFYIKECNLIVEIKSSHTFEKHYLKNIEKKKSCERKLYNFIFIIEKDYTEFENEMRISGLIY